MDSAENKVKEPCCNSAESIQKRLEDLRQKLSKIQDDMRAINQGMIEMNNHMTVLLNPQIYGNGLNENREMITGIIEHYE